MKVNIPKLLFVFFLFSTNQLVAQIDYVSIQNIARQEGLSNSNVNCLAQDTSGFIWIGTADGLNRYDGYQIKTFYNNPTDETSISDNNITALCVDLEGQLWVGTSTGSICRYNPVEENFIRYKSNTRHYKGVSHQFITDFAIDANGRLWASSQEGINLYHKDKDQFEQFNFGLTYEITDKSIGWLSDNISDSEQLVELAKKVKGKVFNSRQDFFAALQNSSDKELTKEDFSHLYEYAYKVLPEEIHKFNKFKKIVPDSDGNLWLIYQEEGFAFFNPKTMELEKILTYPETSKLSHSNSIRSAILDGDYIWLGTFNDGIYIYSKKNRTYKKVFDKGLEGALAMIEYNDYIVFFSEATMYMYPKSVAKSNEQTIIYKKFPEIQYNITSLMKDKAGNYWVATEGVGVFMIYINKQFNVIDDSPNNRIRLTQKEVSSIYASSDNKLYIGYFRNNMDVMDIGSKDFETFIHNENNPSGIGWGSVLAITEDKNQNILLGSYYSGLQIKNKENNIFQHYEFDDIKDFRRILVDENNNIWLASHGKGLLKINKNGKIINYWKADFDKWLNQIPDNWLNDITIDHKGRVWIATAAGLCKADTAGKVFKSYRPDPNNHNSISQTYVMTVFCDSNGNIWIGTSNGLNLYNEKNDGFRHISIVNGLANNQIYSVVEDNNGNIWLGTNNGISKLTIEYDGQIKIRNIDNYDFHDGVPGEFYPRVVTKDRDGAIYFGGKNGICWFYPDSIRPNDFIPKVAISDIEIFNLSIFDEYSEFKHLRKSFVERNTVSLDYEQNVITLNFSALSFIESKNNQYLCKLEGFDTKWQNLGAEHRVTYTNLEPGNYIFKVKAINNDGVHSTEITQLKVKVNPPFWRSALGIFIVIIIALIFITIGGLLLKNWIKLRNRIKYRKLEAEKLKELDKSKSKFFTNVSHEFRTPITLILGPIKKILSTKDKDLSASKIKPQLQLVYRNAELLLRLVNQILDFKKADAGELKFKPTLGNVMPFILNIAETFNSLAMEKNIVFNVSKNANQLFMSFAPDKLEKIIYNLLSNSFKYTLESGRVDFKIEVIKNQENSNKKLCLIVEDDGIGIAKENQENIFNLYYQADNANIMGNHGTGVGLYMVKTYTELHGGTVSFESELNKGSVFRVEIPVIAKVEQKIKPEIRKEIVEEEKPFAVSKENDLMNILIVEDNVDIVAYLKVELQELFNVKTAGDGMKALEILKEYKPDVILSDIMMPNMDGYELCKQVKRNISLCHIPFILLTAKTSHESKMKGYALGADDYITKPFEPEILIVKIQRILENRKNVQSQLSNSPHIIPNELRDKNSADSAFLEKLLKILETNLDNSEMDVEFLAKELSISRTVMYEKINVLTGQPVADFIKTYRLNRAAQMIKKGEARISEIVWSVGFKSHAHFTRAFKQKFNCTPSQYKN